MAKKMKLKLPNCNYREIWYFQKFSKNLKTKNLSLFDINVCSLTKIFGEFGILSNDLNAYFDILAIKESRIKKDSSSSKNL